MPTYERNDSAPAKPDGNHARFGVPCNRALAYRQERRARRWARRQQRSAK